MAEADKKILAVEYDAYGGPEVLRLRQTAAPKAATGDVLVRVRAVSINPVDWKIRSGMLQQYFPVTFPTITGRDGAGDVIAVAAGVDASLVGRRVCFLAPRGVGTWSQMIALPAPMAVEISPALSYEQAAA